MGSGFHISRAGDGVAGVSATHGPPLLGSDSILPALRDQQIGVSAVNNRGIHAITPFHLFPISSGGYGTMLHDRDFAAFTGEHCTCEIRIQLWSGSGHLGRDNTHLSRLLPLIWMIAGPGSRNDFPDRINSYFTQTVRNWTERSRTPRGESGKLDLTWDAIDGDSGCGNGVSGMPAFTVRRFPSKGRDPARAPSRSDT
jgi:hypothetical protein